jgi:ligand-binding SRPBCC domain-containing protein
MPDVSKRILTDETGQDIVTALTALTNVVDPNGTTVAAALKLNNMTTSVTVLPTGSTPTSSLTEVDGHFHLTLGIPL